MKELVELAGTVIAHVRDAFKVRLDDSGRIVLCRIGGKLFKYHVKVCVGDKVQVEMAPGYDMTKGRITYRFK